MAQVSRLWPYGGSGGLYGSFAGKTEATLEKGAGPFSILWPYGGSGGLYGSFAGKTEAEVVAPTKNFIGLGAGFGVRRRFSRTRI